MRRAWSSPGSSRVRGPPARILRPVTPLAATAVPIASFATVAAVAEIAGAANLGTALGIGQVGFAVALVYVLLRG